MSPGLPARGGWLGRAREALREARRRRVVRTALVYAGVVLVVVEGASMFRDALGLPGWTASLVAVLAILGFPVAISLAWAFDITAEGVRRTERTEQERWLRAQRAFEGALDLPATERSAFLEEVEAGAPGLRAEVEALIRSHEAEGPMDRLARAVVPLVEPIRSNGLSPGDDVQHYRILEPLGGGGMGVVYRAKDRRLDRTVALKFLPWYLAVDESAHRRFLAEAQAAAALDHPNICTIHEIGEHDGRFFIAMPYYAGGSLDARVGRGPLPVAEALDVVTQVALGLASAHQQGILHRDIKPGNLVVTPEGVVKILDFGVAKTSGRPLTAEDQVVGTVAYMSPEQARGEVVDRRTDLWSLGVVLYELLTGVRPFQGHDPRATLLAVLQSDPPPASTGRPGLPPAVDLLVSRLLEKDREVRPPTAHAVVRALEELTDTFDVSPEGPRAASGEGPHTLSPEGERRQATLVTLLVPGYEALVERLSPEELKVALGQRRGRAEVVLARRGGVLNECAGDRLVAVFGVPTTHEDDAARAVEAAFELVALGDEWAEGAERAQAGVATGLVVARRAERTEGGFLLVGGAVEAAERLARGADPGRVLLSAESRHLVASAFETAEAGTVDLPGGGAARVYEARGRRPAVVAVGVERSALTTYAGRDRELDALEGHLRAALDGEGRLVVVLGEAGVGKSRLVHEFLSDERDPRVRVLRGRCPSHGSATPYLPFLEALRDLLGTEDAPAGEDPAERVAQRLEALSPELSPWLPLYLNLMGIPSERHGLPRHLRGEHFKAGIREALAAAFTVGLGGRPGILVLEDWHWVDTSSREALRQLVEVLPGTPLLVVVTCRPGYGVEWTSALPHAPLFLGPLDAEAAGAVARAVLAARTLSEDVVALLDERAGGNPFFLEELCHSLREEGAVEVVDGRARLVKSPATLHLPGSVQGIIRTRLDRLDPETRDVLRVASVIGREPSLPLLAEACPPGLRPEAAVEELKQLGLFRQLRVLPEPVYRFKHVLTQEVVYDTMLQHQRAALHGRVGSAIERLHGDALEEWSERLTHHFVHAENWARAVRYGRTWAARAEALSEFSDALGILERVEGWIERLSDDRYGQPDPTPVLLAQEHACEILGFRDRQLELIDRLVARHRPSGDPRTLAEVYRRQGDVFTLLRRFDEAAEVLERCLRLTRAHDDTAAERQALRSLGLMAWHAGRLDDALGWVEEAVAIGRDQGDDEALVGDLTNLAQIRKDRGEAGLALSAVEEALALSDRVGDALKKPYLLHVMANVYRARGDFERTIELLEGASEFTREHRMPIQRSFHLTSIASIRLQQGDVEEALRLYLEAVAVGRRARNADGLSHSLRMAGQLLARLGRDEEALPLLQEALTLFAQLGRPDLEERTWAVVADLRRRTGDAVGAVGAWTRVRELCHEAGNREGELEAVEGLARTIRDGAGDPAVSLPHYHDALKLARSLGDGRREGELRNTLGIIAWRAGAYHEALEHYRRALELAREQADAGREGLALNSLGTTLRSLGRREEALRVLEEALALHRRSGQRLLEGHALACLGDVHADLGDPGQAREAYGSSLELRRALDDRRGEGWMLLRLAQVEERLARPASARRLAGKAGELARAVDDALLARACSAVMDEKAANT